MARAALPDVWRCVLATVFGAALWSFVRLEVVQDAMLIAASSPVFRWRTTSLEVVDRTPWSIGKPRFGRDDLLLPQDALVRAIVFPVFSIVVVTVCLTFAIALVRPQFGQPRSGLKRALLLSCLWRSISLLALVLVVGHLVWWFFFGVYSAAWTRSVSVGVSLNPSIGLMMFSGSLVAWLGGTFALTLGLTRRAKARIAAAENRCESCGYEDLCPGGRCPECGHDCRRLIGSPWVGRSPTDRFAGGLFWFCIAVSVSSLTFWTSPMTVFPEGSSWLCPAEQPQRALWDMRNSVVFFYDSWLSRYPWLFDEV